VHIDEFDEVGVVDVLHDLNFVVQHVHIGSVHLFEFDDFNCVPNRLYAIPDALVDLAAVSASDEVLHVETVASDTFLTFVLESRHLFAIAIIDIDGRAVGASHTNVRSALIDEVCFLSFRAGSHAIINVSPR
jgi:hypothetical protein